MAHVTVGAQESDPIPVQTAIIQECVLAPVLFSIFPICITHLLPKELQHNSGAAVDFRLDGNLFNIRRLQGPTKLSKEWVLQIQFADDCALLSLSPHDLQSLPTYNRMGLAVNSTKTEVIYQRSPVTWHSPPVLTVSLQLLTIALFLKYLGSIQSEDCSTDH